MQRDSTYNRVTRFIDHHTEFIMIALTLIIVGCTLTTVVFAFITIRSSEDTLRKQEELVDWFMNPRPLYQNWTNIDSEIRETNKHIVYTWKDYDPEKGLSSDIWFYNTRTIKIYINNAGRAPITGTIMSLEINSNDLVVCFPFKIYKISTPVYWIDYDQENKTLIDSHGKNLTFVNNYKAIDFPPVMSYDGGHIKITNLWNILVGSIAPEQTVEIEIGLFSSIINATGSLHISFESENEETHTLSIPLESKEIGT